MEHFSYLFDTTDLAFHITTDSMIPEAPLLSWLTGDDQRSEEMHHVFLHGGKFSVCFLLFQILKQGAVTTTPEFWSSVALHSSMVYGQIDYSFFFNHFTQNLEVILHKKNYFPKILK
jgi:hypothetical protein